ncbi:MAG: glycosyltransferase family 2 protein [Magnetococcales bacterium]|nr:glycosyltransferase family 2 protein [Magnetococcales bacterium]
MNPPTVSVLMSVHNGERFLTEAIVSIHRQTWTDFEFIIIDDASTDTSGAIIHDWASRDHRIIPITNETNLGLTRSLNKGIRLARGRWIARMDADDRSLPERLSRQLDLLDHHPGVGLLGSAAWVMDPEKNSGDTCQINPATHPEICWRLVLANPFFHASVIFDRRIALDNPYDESLRFGQDFELWGRFLAVTEGANLAVPLVRLGRHEQRVSVQHAQRQSEIGRRIIKQRLLKLMPESEWNDDLIRQMRQIVQTDWPTPTETPEAWKRLLDLFLAFNRQRPHDHTPMQNIRSQLVRRLLFSLLSPGGVRPSRSLLRIIITDFPLATLEELFKHMRKRVSLNKKS